MIDVSVAEHPCITAIVERWDGPITRPISFVRTGNTNELKAESWTIKVYKLTKAGNISKNGGGYLRLEYCPICGERLGEAKEGQHD
jgi:hypothetical protein